MRVCSQQNFPSIDMKQAGLPFESHAVSTSLSLSRKISGIGLPIHGCWTTAMNAQQLRIYAIADIHSPDSFRMAQLSPETMISS